MIYQVFNYNFFAQFQAVNKNELVEELNKEVVVGANDYDLSLIHISEPTRPY